MGLYRELLIVVSHLRPDCKEENDLYQPLIPPIPAFFKAISALMILSEMMIISETINDIGNGKIKDTITTVTRDTNNQARFLFPPMLLLSSALLINCFSS
jgi:hypothetical protein